ncbi:MAG: LON peptidase substrate-binding domain-containing protein [Gemmatimonadaceae bacterium]
MSASPSPTPGARRLAIFPLPLVLFPGARLPLHIFEPRYRRLLADCQGHDLEFGIVYREGTPRDPEIERGTVGSVAHIDTVAGLPDGRSNIIVHGVSRFEVLGVRPDPAPYLVADVQPVVDREEPEEVLRRASRAVRELVGRVGKAAQSIADDGAPMPDFPVDAASLSFAIAQSIDLDVSVRQALLESRSPLERLRQLEHLLRAVTPAMEERASTHERAHSNGRGPGVQA